MENYIVESKSKNKKNQIEKISTLERYFTVIREFYKFLNNNGFTNDELMIKMSQWDSDEDLRMNYMKNIIKRYNLKETKKTPCYNEIDLETILKEFYKTIDNTDINTIFNNNKHTDYKIFVSALILLTIYETGIKYRVIDSFIVSDINIGNKLIKIGAYEIPISTKLAESYEKYFEIRRYYNLDSIKLFVGTEVTSSPKYNTFVSDYMGSITRKVLKRRRTDTTGLAKNKIIELLSEGVPEVLIKEWTTFTDIVVSDCRYEVTKYNANYQMINEFVNKTFKNFS